LNKLEVG
jgi:hypothetical protein